MKKIISALIILCTVYFASAEGGLNFSINFSTGDSEIDTVLNEINRNAKTNINAFMNEIEEKYQVGKTFVNQLLDTDWSPSDITLAATIAGVTGSPMEKVTETFKQNRDKGWGAMARELGIKPGSKEFKDMKAALKGNKKEKQKPEKGQKGKKNK